MSTFLATFLGCMAAIWLSVAILHLIDCVERRLNARRFRLEAEALHAERRRRNAAKAERGAA